MTDAPQPEIIAYKGFNLDLSCRGHKFEIGKTYEMDGPIKACARGFHACEHPLNVFDYYPPAGSRFAEVRLSGEISRKGDDTKVAAARISITAELGIAELVDRAVKWVFARSNPDGEAATGYQGAASATGDRGAASATGYQGAASATGNHGAASATGNQGAASATGYQGAASATGYQGAASATGYQGAASATGNQGAASATGYQGAASATGDQGAASATGDRGAAMAAGRLGKASGKAGNALFLVSRDKDWNIVHAWAGIVGRDGIDPDVWYRLDADGRPQPVTNDE